MNIKTYLMTNSSPLLDNPQNILILEWLEGNSFYTLKEISARTNIPLNQVSEIIQILYKNNLVTYIEDKYKITTEGIKLLDKLGLSDLQISTILDQADFQTEEYAIYKSIFHEWRANFLSIYLLFFDAIDNVYNDICNSFSHIIESPKMGHSLLIASLLHEFSYILYQKENSNLMKYYNILFDYSFTNYCISSEVYHTNSNFWTTDTNRIVLINNFNNSLNTLWKKSNHKLLHFNSFIKNNVLFMPGYHDIKHNINHDFSISHNLITNPELLGKIFISQNLTELSKEFNWTEYQTIFILKSIRSKIDALLLTEKADITVISSNI